MCSGGNLSFTWLRLQLVITCCCSQAILSKSNAQSNFTVIPDLLHSVQPKLKYSMRKSAAASGNVPPVYCIYQFGSELRPSTSPLFQRTSLDRFIVTSGLYVWIIFFCTHTKCICPQCFSAFSTLWSSLRWGKVFTLQFLSVLKKQKVRWELFALFCKTKDSS